MHKRTRQLCLILVLGLVIGLPALASVSYADLVGPDFNSSIIGVSGEIDSISEGTLSHNGSVVTLTPTSINVTNALPNLVSYGALGWTGSGAVNLTFDYTIDLGDNIHGAGITVEQNLWNGFVFQDSVAGIHHFAETLSSPYPLGFAGFHVSAIAEGNRQVTISNLSVTAVPLPPTLFLLGSGLLGLAGWRRFRKG
jgi:hypothetical protein